MEAGAVDRVSRSASSRPATPARRSSRRCRNVAGRGRRTSPALVALAACRGRRPHDRRTRRRRWSRASSMRFAAAGLRLLRADERPPRGSRAPRRSPRNSCAATAFPTARLRTLHARDLRPGRTSRAQRPPIVVKASGLAAGKGVIIAPSAGRGDRQPRGMFAGAFGDAGPRGGRSRNSSRARKRASSSWRTAATCCRSRPRQDHKRLRRRRPGTQHGRHGRVFARAGRHAGGARRASCAR